MGEIIGITFEGMNNAKIHLNSSNEANKDVKSKLNAAIEVLQVECLTSHLSQAQEAIRGQISSVDKSMDDVDRVIEGIDYAIRRFQEVDNNCASRIQGKVDEYIQQNQIIQFNGGVSGIAGVGTIGGFKNFNKTNFLETNDFNSLQPSSNSGYNNSYINQGTGTVDTSTKVEDPDLKTAASGAATSPDSLLGYMTVAVNVGKRSDLLRDANSVYRNTVLTNSSSKVEAYRKIFDVIDESEALRSKAAAVGKGGVRSFGTKLGVFGAVVGGGICIYSDVNNINYDTVDKQKAVTVDVVQMAATIGAIVIIAALPATVTVAAVIGIGLVAGTAINWLAQTAKEEWID